MLDTRRLDDTLQVGPNEPMTDEEIDAMLAYYEARGVVQAGRMAQLLDELRELPEGLASRVRAGHAQEADASEEVVRDSHRSVPRISEAPSLRVAEAAVTVQHRGHRRSNHHAAGLSGGGWTLTITSPVTLTVTRVQWPHDLQRSGSNAAPGAGR